MAGSGLLWLALTSCILTLASTSQHSDRIPRAAISHVQELSCGDPDTPEADDCFDPCENYTELDEPSRGTNSKERIEACDDHLSGWYRFQSDGGITLLEECIPMFKCHTDAPLWLNGAHPKLGEGIVSRTVCAHWVENCCFWEYEAEVKACLDYSRYPDDPDLFYVYQLEPTTNCNLRYCTDRNSTAIMCRYPECRSVERCSYRNKEWSCRCRKKYNDSEIQSLQPILQCGASEITLTIDTCLLGGLEIEELIGSLTNGKAVDIEPGSDTYSRNVIIPFDSFDYPDTTKNDAVYKDTITFKSTETESILLQVNFDCTYPLDYEVSPPNVLKPLVSPWIISVSGEGKFNVVMGFYDEDFKKPIEDDVIELPVDSIVYVKAKLKEGDRGHFKTVLRNCYATADIYPVDYPLIKDRSAQKEKVLMEQPSAKRRRQI
ncbi:pancreatic secretory granule membrane major glycoprotein GP2-like [Ochotona princeps]|uniref:pancreatic secretory granule membrane major glycoprotein GP2-like n=1 Tax=Ochotona princeps TaxID=9978 RepID=UPI002714F50E|nr:pancreatic secretory granule membrane major glycoprotein GP2-like [Ochotona princeps]